MSKNQTSPVCYMLIGLPGAGKTTIRQQLLGVVVSTDDYIEQYANEWGLTYNSVWKKYIKHAEKLAMGDLDYAIKNSYNIVWDQTNLTKEVRAKKLAKLPQHYKKVAIYVITPPEDEWYHRLEQRPGKQIDRNTLQMMRNRLEFPSSSEGFTEIMTVENGNKVDWN